MHGDKTADDLGRPFILHLAAGGEEVVEYSIGEAIDADAIEASACLQYCVLKGNLRELAKYLQLAVFVLLR